MSALPQPAVPQAARPADARSLSCVIPCYNEAENLRQLLPLLERILESSRLHWEVIVVDDGSTDATAQVAREWCQLAGFRFLGLSRNFGKEAALSAGLSAARGDAVVLLDGDLQHGPELILSMVRHWQAGAEVVYAVRENRADESRFKRLGTRLFYRMVNVGSRVPLPEDAGDFRLMDRKVVDALLSLPERSRFMKGLYAWVGFRTLALPYTPAPRTRGASTFSVLRLLNLALDGLTAFSTWPLRLISVAGLLIAIPALGYGAYLVLNYLRDGEDVPGWSTLAVGLMFLIGVQMLSIGIVGEYIGRIFEEVKGRPLFVVRESAGEGLEPQQTD
jgi:glycosyltransferase involved in cell wall biosynthesis